jgi:hypothetical protein
MTSSIATQVLKMFSEIHSRVSEDYDLSVREKKYCSTWSMDIAIK